jgi:hypothetical protein
MSEQDAERREAERLGRALGARGDREADEFEAVAAELALAAEPVEPRPELKAALFARIASTPQLPAEEEPAERETAVEEAVPAPTPGPAELRARRRWFSRPAAILTAVGAAVVIFIGGAFVGSVLAGGSSYQQQQASALAELNAASDVQRATADVAGGGSATLVWSADLQRSALIADGLPKLADGKVYELWYIADGAATPAGTMVPGDSGAAWRVLTGEMTPGATVGVTVEPRGGSDQPTTKPIVAIPS